ncbi:DegT/DnrJ/EryC1/StrS family aminotransferase [Roseateles saccharophilus]|uniref:dTDP-4-amino-4,6-dideoxygalactose transaminase n=1 Tax=Roseateles saccharophilus TaxID=304 RepID=A0A4R3VI35_ROSSA|nr:DegT/DnrJ/EryC1/StrS family aminotransferase [Roseateles saccharophilus]MDG0832036.1 DegT/DnrJ/EryC1/StrS family aminotransferase [Roseateles saccharophilus]TCV03444.1 dTDP-4-amino-4,6-dideoxygalactose transaminase [Roseateles saccharophilus]
MDTTLTAQEGNEADDFDLPDDWLRLCDPDLSGVELQLVQAALEEPQLSCGRMVQHFEQGFARHHGRRHGIAVASGTIATWLLLRALGIGPGDEVVASPYGWHQVGHAVTLTGARLVFADINYWSGCLDPVRAAGQIGPATKALLVGNVNGHPADWGAFETLATERGLALLEDSTEAIGSRWRGRLVGSFGRASVFDFSQPSALCCGEGGMVLTDDDALAAELRYLRARSLKDRRSVSVGSRVPLQAAMSELTAAVAAGQLARLPEILARRLQVAGYYLAQMQTFEGIKPPYVAPDVDEVHWMVYTVHLGKRFTASACDEIIEDMADDSIEAVMYCQPLHQQFHYVQQGWRRGQFPLVERIADRAVALPFHGHLQPDHVRFIVKTMKDSSVNVGAGAAIY